MDDIKLALLGSKEAAKRLTDAGVLLPCPFCGGEAELIVSNDNHRQPYVHCKFGSSMTPMCAVAHTYCWDYHSEYDARLAWNTRAPILSAEEMEMLEGIE